MTTPYVPHFPLSPMRNLYRSTAQVMRLTPTMLATGAMNVAWTQLTSIVDVVLNQPGLLQCRLDLQFTRPGKDAPMPSVAGRAPDRVGVIWYDPVVDAQGRPLLKSGDRLVMVQGPIFGTFELRQIPEVAQDFTGAHHVENQVVEVSQALQPGSPTPFPGVQP